MWKALSLFVFLVSCSQPLVKQSSTAKKRKYPKITRSKPEVVAEEPKTDLKLLKKLQDKNAVILDMRDVNAFVNGHLKGAQHMDFLKADFEGRVTKLDRNKRYLLYCSTGGLSGKAIHYFVAQKLRVENIGTFDELMTRGAPVEGVEID